MSPPPAAAIVWDAWGAEPFARAARERKPVLLSISARWCHACHQMDATTWADARVAALVGDRFVALRVDSDRRPDINERYNLGGWPTTAFLTPTGELLGGGTFVALDRIESILMRVLAAFDPDACPPSSSSSSDHRGTVTGSSGAPPAPGALTAAARTVGDRVLALFDEAHGGFGIEPKFPHTAPIRLALARFGESGDPVARRIAERTLDAMAEGALHDPVDGGFFRYAAARDWQLPHLEKLLETNASLLGAFVEAERVFGDGAYLEVIGRTIRYLDDRLGDPAGGYSGSEEAAPEYYGATERTGRTRPEVDRTLFTDANGAAVSALLAASSLLEDNDLAARALRALERVVLAAYRPGDGVAHCADCARVVRGLLADQCAVVHAMLDAHDRTGDEPYLMMAEEIAHYVLRALWDEAGGTVRDRVPRDDDVGLLAAPEHPFVTGCEAARAFARLARVSDESAFRGRAESILLALYPRVSAQGPLAAHYALAARAVLAP
ncbi:MAG TPA: DUF255 domain-containing protein [Vicinamibacterales bacterium]|nr:DUF255 domain-containing protein [Vicinamibacterales bacterium]